MTDIYSAEQRSRDLHPSNHRVLGTYGGVTLTTRPFDGQRWFVMVATDGSTIAVSAEELGELVSGASEALHTYEEKQPPVQLRLFNPDSLEDSNADRLDPA